MDFTNSELVFRSYGGSDRKFSIKYNNEYYMIKFSEEHSKKTDISTSCVNNVVSEYISSHIAGTMGLSVHETFLGTYDNELVVACKDFRGQYEENYEFQEFLRAMYDSKDSRKFITLKKIYSVYDNEKIFPQELRDSAIENFWDMFIVDALVGNFDRHTGNWGFIIKDNKIKLAPLYDFGSTLLPQLSDEGMEKLVNDKLEIVRRCYIFPSPVMYVTDDRVGKVGYYDMLSSNYDENCTKALIRMYNKIDLQKIASVIQETPYITKIRKDFYTKYITTRKEYILDRAYDRCINKNYDKEALNRIISGKNITEEDVKKIIESKSINRPRFDPNLGKSR